MRSALPMTALTLDLSSVIRLTHEQFEQLALANRDCA